MLHPGPAVAAAFDALKECAYVLRCSIEHQYAAPDVHPALRRKYEC